MVRIGLYKISPKCRKNCLANDPAPGIKDKNRSISITTAHGGYLIMLGVFVRIFLISFCLMGVFLFFAGKGFVYLAYIQFALCWGGGLESPLLGVFSLQRR